jgi:hypothetical protein
VFVFGAWSRVAIKLNIKLQGYEKFLQNYNKPPGNITLENRTMQTI